MPPYPHVEGVRHSHVSVDGVRLHVAEAGDPDGDPVVLLVGWPQHWYAWRRVIPRIVERHRVICMDLRGLGWSDAPDTSYAKEELAGDVLGVLDALELERVRLVGHDWGGLVTFLAGLRAPERFSALLVLSMIHPWPALAPVPLRTLPALAYQPLVGAPVLGPLVQRVTPFYDLFWRLAGPRAGITAEDGRAFAEPLRDPARARACSRYYRTFLTRELPQLLAGAYAGRRLVVPTRLVVGRDDPVIKEGTLQGWRRHADDMTVEWVDGGHFLPDERPELVAERILRLP